MTHNDFLPLADVSDKAGETEESKKREEFCQPQDPGKDFANIRIVNNLLPENILHSQDPKYSEFISSS